MIPALRRTVVRLCQAGRADDAVRVLRRTRPEASASLASADRIAFLRLLGYALEQAGRVRSAAAAYWRALRLMRDCALPVGPADWAPLAAAYRRLWETTGVAAHYRSYLRFTREGADRAQTRLAGEALGITVALPAGEPPARRPGRAAAPAIAPGSRAVG